ncbi:hypothetical protein LEP1GSC083_4931 [Leptospira interrogans serovar Pyrogenes str. L0374]|uniref:Uncharacterized protein n=2 Tax=Leptospira interrogans TaxID=173 RepID=M6K901_LEPIR|nr:hypothetical protein LEP1GSC158_0811 [Leptospira interrogans serovar Zanoni str. LT2156]EMN28163.1 hypothetical protein LEP1GSC083_4931 [Leptospira interrogans serovar Pyrogenes str. L0374]
MVWTNSYIILWTNLGFVIVPTFEYDRFNCYKLLFFNCGSSHILRIDLQSSEVFGRF